MPILRRARPDIPIRDQDFSGPMLRRTHGGGIETDDTDYTLMVFNDFEDSLQGGYFVTEVIPEVTDPNEETLTRSEHDARN